VLTGWTIVTLIALSAAVAQAFGRFSYGLLLPAVRDDLGISNTMAGLVGAANVGAYLLGTMFVAWATSRYRLLGVLRLGLVLSTTGLLAASFANSPYGLATALFIAGIGGACVWIPAPMIAADALPPAQRGLAIGLMGSGVGLGVVLLGVLAAVRHQQAAPSGGGGFGGFGALKRMRGWLPLLFAYTCFGFMYLLVMGFLTTRLEDDSYWTNVDAAFAFTLMGFAMIFGGPLFVAIANRFGPRSALAMAFGLWPVFIAVVLTGHYVPTLVACVGLGFLFSGLPSLITLYVVENTAIEDYGPSFAAATLAFGLAQTISPPIGGFLADLTGSFMAVFLLSGFIGVLGLLTSLQLPKRNQ